MYSSYLIIDLNKPVTYERLNTFIENITDYFQIKKDLTFFLNNEKKYLYIDHKTKLKRLIDSNSKKVKSISLYSLKISKAQCYFDELNNNSHQFNKLQNISDIIINMIRENKTFEQIVYETSLDDIIFLLSNTHYLSIANRFFVWQQIPRLLNGMSYEGYINFADQVQDSQSETDYGIYKIGEVIQPYIKMYIDNLENIRIFFSPLLFLKDFEDILAFLAENVDDLICDYPNAVAYLDIANRCNTEECTPHESFFNCRSSKFNYLENLRGYPRYCWINNIQKELLNLNNQTKLIDVKMIYNKNGVQLNIQNRNGYKKMKEIFKPLLIQSEETRHSNMILFDDPVRMFSVIDRSEWIIKDEMLSDENRMERCVIRAFNV